jgi:hypothetical protein
MHFSVAGHIAFSDGIHIESQGRRSLLRNVKPGGISLKQQVRVPQWKQMRRLADVFQSRPPRVAA